MKALKGRNLRAWGHRHRNRDSLIHQALKGRNIYVALSGLQQINLIFPCGVATGYQISPLRGFLDGLLSMLLLQASDAAHNALLQRRVIAKTFKPLDARLAAKPCQLALGIMTHIELGLFDGALKAALTT